MIGIIGIAGPRDDRRCADSHSALKDSAACQETPRLATGEVRRPSQLVSRRRAIEPDAERLFSALLPRPKRVNPLAGTVPIARLRADVRLDDDRLRTAAEAFTSTERDPASPAPENNPGALLSLRLGKNLAAEAYRLRIAAGEMSIEGGSAAGCFWGLQTVKQLLDAVSGTGPKGGATAIPAVEIDDAPDFPVRGILHDITRGRVPTLATLKLLIDRAAGLKLNEVHLYIEHAFVFSFDDEICPPNCGLLPDEARELCAYARSRFVRIVPALANLGHMGRILSMRKYAHLAERPLRATWSELPWPERLRGATIRSRDPQARRLISKMLGDVIDAFPGESVNICGDEPWDIGLSERDPLTSDDAKRAAYLDHVRFVSDLCARQDRRVQVWSDYLLGSGASGSDLPDNATILHWGYDEEANYGATHQLAESGARVVVCPGTSSWKRVLPALRLAERNVNRFVEVGATAHAAGVLMTDWGDHGHFHMPAGSFAGIAHAADRAWNAGDGARCGSDAALVRQALPLQPEDADAGVRVLAAMRSATDIAGGLETWRLLWSDRSAIADEVTQLNHTSLGKAEEAARALAAMLGTVHPPPDARAVDHAELLVASRFLELMYEKLRIVRGERSDPGDWADRLRSAAVDYAALWQLRSKPSDLVDVLRALEHAATDIQRSDSA